MSNKLIIFIVAAVLVFGGVLVMSGVFKQTPSGTGATQESGAVNQDAPAAVNSANGTVVIENFAFTPAVVTIAVGGTVTWQQKDLAPHKIVSDAELFESKDLSAGDTFTYAFTQAGEYAYHCSIHPSMTGKIIVK